MKAYGVNELRSMFLDYFRSKDHLVMKSFPLVPHHDKSLLIINSGMAPLKPYFTGQEVPPKKRVATCQKCIRTGDIDNVGKTARHGTFFEMLGNFSFGDYFKKEAIEFSWEFLTKVVGIPEDRLYPSVYEEDDEAFRIWNEDMKIPAERIFRFGKADNFWEHGAGPCGPCSEIYFDRGEEYGCGDENCTVGCDCDRYMEVWNDVFTQFENDGKGHYTELIQKNIDTGMGLERLAVAVQGVPSIFDVDTIRAVRDHVCRLAGVTYGEEAEKDVSIRVITDHIRSVSFMISDGILPSNEGRGYVLRRLLRRAARHGKLLGIEGAFLQQLLPTVIETSGDAYPELREREAMILSVIEKEENRFHQTLDSGLSILKEYTEELKAAGETVLSGEKAFRLYDTFGFPVDLTTEILQEAGFTVDMDGFRAESEASRKRAKGTWKATNYMGAEETVFQSLDTGITNTFTGYDHVSGESVIQIIARDDEILDGASEGESVTILTAETPFYATKGGQEGDRGIITGPKGRFFVEETVVLPGERIGHKGHVEEGFLVTGDAVQMHIDEKKRMLTARNHSATHLLHKALVQVLGPHVAQAGSYVSDTHLRFDFTHFKAMTPEEISEVENIVRREIQNALPVCTKLMNLEEAKASGAMALFDEKYKNEVRVVSMGDFSKELCGGTHVKNTEEIASFKILSEGGIAAGVRRIEAITSDGLFAYYEKEEALLHEAAELLKVKGEELPKRVHALLDELRSLKQENESLKQEKANRKAGELGEGSIKIGETSMILQSVDGATMDALRSMSDSLRDSHKSLALVLVSRDGDKVNLLVSFTDDLVKKGLHAGNTVKALAPLIGGGGGGRPNMAQAGGKNAAGIPSLLKEAEDLLRKAVTA